MTKEKKQLFSDKNCERVQMWKTLFYAYKLTTMKKTDECGLMVCIMVAYDIFLL